MYRPVPKHLSRKAEYDIDDILSRTKVDLSGYWCRRLQVYKQKGVECVKCGIKGTFFALEKHWKQNTDRPKVGWHLNLYADTPNGGIRLMTIDHIVPVSRGGAKKKMKNLQPMCAKCNGRKGNTLPTDPPKVKKKKSKRRVRGGRRQTYWQRVFSLKAWKRRLKWMWYNRSIPKLPKRV